MPLMAWVRLLCSLLDNAHAGAVGAASANPWAGSSATGWTEPIAGADVFPLMAWALRCRDAEYSTRKSRNLQNYSHSYPTICPSTSAVKSHLHATGNHLPHQQYKNSTPAHHSIKQQIFKNSPRCPQRIVGRVVGCMLLGRRNPFVFRQLWLHVTISLTIKAVVGFPTSHHEPPGCAFCATCSTPSLVRNSACAS